MLWKPRNFVALLIATMACWTERQAAAQLDYLKVENRALSPAPSRTYGMTLSANF